MRFWVGGYGEDHNGAPAEGIGMLVAGEPDGALAGGPLAYTGTAAPAPSPSWVTAHPTLDVVYAALEGEGAVQAFRRVSEDRLAPMGAPVPAGVAACHVAVEPNGAFLLVSCWGDGRVVRVPLGADGALGDARVAPAAADPYGSGSPAADAVDPGLAAAARALRAAAGAEYADLVPGYGSDADAEPAGPEPEPGESPRVSRAHEALFLPGGTVVTTDLGFDLVRVWHAAGAGLRRGEQIALPEGCGPRHMVWHPSGHLYVLTEYTHEVFVLSPDADGAWHVRGGAPAAVGALEGDTGAELAASRDGQFLYAGIRGSDTLGVLRVRGGGEAVEPVALVEAGVRRPRHHVVVRDTLLVAGQASDEVVSLSLDLRTGIPGGVRYRTPAPAPTCLLPTR
ncbi:MULTISPECIES: lactonase family protein [Microbacterium]|uniref:3-carboxymuconate cyclase n=1 Tax=Microbacterium wangchenii TaxID=2541726 RepID=A0ABX5SQY7_9MICO|nr:MULTISPECIES: beta-propeller fold lactonase family protein [Microbacterium]MCK6066301.1 lactonase family protein [Microbacterium sp. EYE_512]QBR87275.1 3-carboxymuconate cyclase [Microbacterium wangchenii]